MLFLVSLKRSRQLRRRLSLRDVGYEHVHMPRFTRYYEDMLQDKLVILKFVFKFIDVYMCE